MLKKLTALAALPLAASIWSAAALAQSKEPVAIGAIEISDRYSIVELPEAVLDDVVKAMGKAFAKVGPARGGRFFAWLLDGASPEERETVTREVPGPVLAVLTGIFGRGYRKNVAPVWKA